MAQNNVKLNPNVFGILKNLDDLQHGINASGIFAILVIHMNNKNVSKLPVSLLVKSTQEKAKAQGIKLNANVSLEAAAHKTLNLLEKKQLVKSENLPLRNGEVCYKINPQIAQF